MNKIFLSALVLVLLSGGYYIWSNGRLPASSKTFQVTSQLPGLPDFQVNYPAEWEEPVVSAEVSSSKIDWDGNVQKLTFYKKGSPHTYPNAGSEVNVNISFFAGPLPLGQTLDDFVDSQLLPTAVEKMKYELVTADGRRIVAQIVSPRSPVTEYYILLGNSTVIEFMTGSPTGADVNLATKARSITDKIIQSININR